MNSKSTQILTLAATLSLLPCALFAQQMSPSQDASAPSGSHEAMQMVPAQAELLNTLDANKLQVGASFKARLDGKVRLANGTELPSGTILIGTVAADDMGVRGNSKLALRFTQAQMKNGSILPIKATIVNVQTQQTVGSDMYGDVPMVMPNNWKDGTLAVDQIGVVSGVDLHSRIASQNSGVFVATRKDDVKLGKGSDLNLALTVAHGVQQNPDAAGAQGQNSGS